MLYVLIAIGTGHAFPARVSVLLGLDHSQV